MVEKAFPSDIEDPGQIFPTKALESGGKEGAVPSQAFSNLMKEGAGSPMAAAGKAPMISPFALMQGTTPVATAPNMNTLLAQINTVHSTLGDINSQLNTPNLKLKASTKYLVKNKLMEANDHLRSFNSKIGAEVPPEPEHSKFSGPLGKFLAYLSDGQAQMNSAKAQLQNIKDKGTHMSATDFLLVQVKLNKATQLLEFTSVLLSNAVSDIKQLMQVQL